MPWTVADVEKHHKGLSDHQKKIWVEVANSVLAKTGDDASAIRQANGTANRMNEDSSADATIIANAASERALKTNKKFDHTIANKLHLIAAHLHSDEFPPNHKAAKYHSAKAKEHSLIENFELVLYAKAADMIETIRLQEAALFWGELVPLQESDPRPRVEKDIKGQPVIPTDDQYKEYFAGMNAAHIETMVNNARSRWSVAASDAEKTALAREMKAGQEVLKTKTLGDSAEAPKEDKKKLARYKAIHTSIKQIAGKNPFLHMIAKHVVDNFLGNPETPRG